jgi:hypothetical protein
MEREETLISALVSTTHSPSVNDEYQGLSVDLHFPRNTQEISGVVVLPVQIRFKGPCNPIVDLDLSCEKNAETHLYEECGLNAKGVSSGATVCIRCPACVSVACGQGKFLVSNDKTGVLTV